MNADLISVLLVEDDPGDVLLVKEAFEDHKVGNALSVVSDGVEAMQYVRGEGSYASAARPDLILLDLNLPRKSGIEVLAEIKGDPQLFDDPSRGPHDLRGRGGHLGCLQTARQRLHHQARRLRALQPDRAPDRRLLHRPREAAAREPARLSDPRARSAARVNTKVTPAQARSLE